MPTRFVEVVDVGAEASSTVAAVLASGADRTVRTKNGTAAEIAAKHGHVAVVELLK